MRLKCTLKVLKKNIINNQYLLAAAGVGERNYYAVQRSAVSLALPQSMFSQSSFTVTYSPQKCTPKLSIIRSDIATLQALRFAAELMKFENSRVNGTTTRNAS